MRVEVIFRSMYMHTRGEKGRKQSLHDASGGHMHMRGESNLSMTRVEVIFRSMYMHTRGEKGRDQSLHDVSGGYI